MLRYITTGIATMVVFLALDSIWISQVALPQYRAAIGGIMQFRPAPAILFYVIYMIGVVFFVLRPAIAGGGWGVALGYGALFGLCAYATYDLTNMATLRDWNWGLALSDMAWGAVVTGVSAALGLIIGNAVLRALGQSG